MSYPTARQNFESGGWPSLSISLASPTQRVPRSFAFFAKGRESEMPAPSGFDHVSTTKSLRIAHAMGIHHEREGHEFTRAVTPSKMNQRFSV
jgi:hypothetical protein